MPEDEHVTILIADITGSTPLYEQAGDEAAMRLVEQCLDGIRAIVRRRGGKFIRSQGDDVLSAFDEPGAALQAAREMLSQRVTGPLAVHVGINFGHVIQSRGDVFGDAVNLTARVSALARPGEVLATRSFVDQLSETDRRQLRLFDHVTVKGRSAPTEIYALLDEDTEKRTQFALGPAPGHTRTRYQSTSPVVSVSLRYEATERHCRDADRVAIGRSANCDIVIDQPWVSRNHLTVTVRHGKVQLSDESSSGTYVSVQEGYDFFMRRETVLLTGSGVISPSLRPDDPRAMVVRYEVQRS